MPWYIFTPPGSGTPDPSDPNQYGSPQGSQPSCFGSLTVCAIQATDNSGKPDITTPLLQEMVQDLNNNTSSTNVVLKT